MKCRRSFLFFLKSRNNFFLLKSPMEDGGDFLIEKSPNREIFWWYSTLGKISEETGEDKSLMIGQKEILFNRQVCPKKSKFDLIKQTAHLNNFLIINFVPNISNENKFVLEIFIQKTKKNSLIYTKKSTE